MCRRSRGSVLLSVIVLCMASKKRRSASSCRTRTCSCGSKLSSVSGDIRVFDGFGRLKRVRLRGVGSPRRKGFVPSVLLGSDGGARDGSGSGWLVRNRSVFTNC